MLRDSDLECRSADLHKGLCWRTWSHFRLRSRNSPSPTRIPRLRSKTNPQPRSKRWSSSDTSTRELLVFGGGLGKDVMVWKNDALVGGRSVGWGKGVLVWWKMWWFGRMMCWWGEKRVDGGERRVQEVFISEIQLHLCEFKWSYHQKDTK